jgi:hypothetical protein
MNTSLLSRPATTLGVDRIRNLADRDPLHADHGKPGRACQRVQRCFRHHEARFAGKSSLGAIDLGSPSDRQISCCVDVVAGACCHAKARSNLTTC